MVIYETHENKEISLNPFAFGEADIVQFLSILTCFPLLGEVSQLS